jgi:leucyl aminopeptidase
MATLTGLQATSTGRFHAAIVSSCEQLENECVIAGKKSGDLGYFYFNIEIFSKYT